jgi:hypothetical protein
MDSNQKTPSQINQKYVELLEKSNVQYHKKRKFFQLRNFLLYSGFLAIAIISGILARNAYLAKKDLFENELTSIPFSKDKILIQSSEGVCYDLNTENTKKWLSHSGILVQIKPQSIQFISSGTPKLNRENNSYTLYTPSNKTFDLILIDGSIVKLNEKSKVFFNLFAQKNDLNVSINGEAYFDIAHQTKQSFKIKSNEFVVEVFGTEFNIKNRLNLINEVALVNGSVKVIGSKSEMFIVPGEKANYNYRTNKIDKSTANFIEILKWNSKFLHFTNERLDLLAAKIGDWYQVSFEFQNKNIQNLSFTGKIKQEDGLIHFLEMLEFTDGIKSKIEKNKIYLYK